MNTIETTKQLASVSTVFPGNSLTEARLQHEAVYELQRNLALLIENQNQLLARIEALEDLVSP